MQEQRLNCYKCEDEGCDLSDRFSLPTCENAVVCWKSTSRVEGGRETWNMGCISSPEQVPFYCSKYMRSSKQGNFHIQCCQENLCNKGPFPVLQYPPTDYIQLITVSAPLIGIFLLICGIYVYYRNRTKSGSMTSMEIKNAKVDSQADSQSDSKSNSQADSKRDSKTDSQANSQTDTESKIPIEILLSTTINCIPNIGATPCGDSTVKAYMQGHSLTSGSGSGLPILVQSTLAQQVSLVECLSSAGGNSKFGWQIWRGNWHDEDVAVKIRFSRDTALWARETEVYSNLLPSRHDNILGHVGSDMISVGNFIQLWIVSHYHKHGSLYKYLRQLSEPLNHRQIMDICRSLVSGLLYLHTGIHGSQGQGKPAMAHRNLNPENIIMKDNGAVAIANLGHVVTQDHLANDKLDLKYLSMRYVSPEIINQTIDSQYLERFQFADIYSLGLMFWEVSRLCTSNGVSLEYAAPYSEWLENDDQEPTLDDMKNLIVTNQYRPSIPNHWRSDPVLTGVTAVMQECWYTKASSRLSILRVKKSLTKLYAKNIDTEVSFG